jgi:hypothetical protein
MRNTIESLYEVIMITPSDNEHVPPARLTRQQTVIPRAKWVSCCVETDRQAVVYIGQMVFSASLIGLCAIMLVRADGDCSVSSPYISLLSFLAGKVLATVVDITQ